MVDYGFPAAGYSYSAPNAGWCTAQLFLSGDFAIAVGLDEVDWVGSDAMPFTVTPAGATVPTISGISFGTPPALGVGNDLLTITGSNFGMSAGIVEVCPEDPTDTDPCVPTTPISWTVDVIGVLLDISSLAPGMPYCASAKTQFVGVAPSAAFCPAGLVGPHPAPAAPVISGSQKIWWLGEAAVNDNCDPGNPNPDANGIPRNPCYYNFTRLAAAPGQGGTAPTLNSPAVWTLIDPATGTLPAFASISCTGSCSQATVTATAWLLWHQRREYASPGDYRGYRQCQLQSLDRLAPICYAVATAA